MPPQHLVAQVDGQPVSPHRPQAHERGHRAERGDSLLLLGLTRLLTASTTTAAAAVIGESERVAEELAAALVNPDGGRGGTDRECGCNHNNQDWRGE